MSADTKSIVYDENGKPAPQYFNPTTNQYEYLQGKHGASRSILYDVDGTPVDMAALLGALETELAAIKGTDFAKQTTLEQVLAKIISSPATEAEQVALKTLIGEKQASPTANTLLARVKALEVALAGILAQLALLETGVQVAGDNMELYGKNVATRPAASAVPVGTVFVVVGTEEAWMSDGEKWEVK